MLEILMERCRDVSAYTRSRVLQVWAELCEEHAVSIVLWNEVASVASGRLEDKSTMVWKSALNLLITMLQHNPFGPQLRIGAFEATLEKYKEKLSGMDPSSAPEDAPDDDDAIQPGVKEQQESISDSCLSEDQMEKDTTVPDIGNAEQIRALVASLEAGLWFSRCITSLMPTLVQLLASSSATDVENTILLLMRCKQFQIDDSDACLRKMLTLVFSQDRSIYEAVENAFITIYISRNSTEIARNLLNLAIDSSIGDITALECLIGSLVSKGDISTSMMTLESATWYTESADSLFKELRFAGFHDAIENISAEGKKSVFVRSYPKNSDANAEEYYHFMCKNSHPTLLGVCNLYEDDQYHVISFEPVHSSLKNLFDNLMEKLITPYHPHQVTDLSSMAIGWLKQIAKTLDHIHSLDKWHGVFKPEEIFIRFGDISDPANPKDGRVLLSMRCLEDIPFDSDMTWTLAKRKDHDWKMVGGLIKKLQAYKELKGQAELLNLHAELDKGVIKSSEQFYNHPAMWDPLQKSMFLTGVFDLLKNITFKSRSFINKGDWTTRYTNVIDLMPKDNTDNQKNPNTFYFFGKLVRNVIVHFDDPNKKMLKSIVGNDRGAALRFFQYEHPDLFLDLLVLARNTDQEGLNTLLSTINRP